MAEKSFYEALPKAYCLVCFKEINFTSRDNKKFVHIRIIFMYTSYVRPRVTKRLLKLPPSFLEVYSMITKSNFFLKNKTDFI